MYTMEKKKRDYIIPNSTLFACNFVVSKFHEGEILLASQPPFREKKKRIFL